MASSPSEAQIVSIYRETIAELYGYVSRRCDGERALAEDITQEAWLRALREWQRTGLPDAPLAWLRTVARNLLLNHVRGPRALDIDALPSLAAGGEGSSPGEDAIDLDAEVLKALQRMPPDEAQLLRAFHFERVRVAGLAERHGLTERAVEGRLRRARARLRTELDALHTRLERGLP